MSTLSITLPEETLQFVESEARRQNYGSPSEFVGSLLNEARRCSRADLLEAKLLAGLASGPGVVCDDDWAAQMKAKVLAHTAHA